MKPGLFSGQVTVWTSTMAVMVGATVPVFVVVLTAVKCLVTIVCAGTDKPFSIAWTRLPAATSAI